VEDTEYVLRRADRLWSNEAVRAWLHDDGEVDTPHATVADLLGRLGDLVDARETTAWLRERHEGALRDMSVLDAVKTFVNDTGDVASVRDAITTAPSHPDPTVAENLADLEEAFQTATEGELIDDAIETTLQETETIAGPLAAIVTRVVAGAPSNC
jgi:hypothetical protein